jgi:hypothetical protein
MKLLKVGVPLETAPEGDSVLVGEQLQNVMKIRFDSLYLFFLLSNTSVLTSKLFKFSSTSWASLAATRARYFWISSSCG